MYKVKFNLRIVKINVVGQLKVLKTKLRSRCTVKVKARGQATV